MAYTPLPPLGQAAMAASLPIVIASDQSAVPISDGGGSITIDATSLPLPTGAATSAKQDTGNTSLASIDTKTPALGQALAAASVPIVLTAAQLTTLTPPTAITGFALDATLTGGTQQTKITDGTNVATVKAASTAAVAADKAVVVAISPNNTIPVSGTFWQATQPVSIAGNQAVNVAQMNGVTVTMGNGVAGTGVQRVTIASDSTGVLASIGSITTAITPGTAAANLGKAEDAAHVSGDTGVFSLALRTDTLAASSGTTGDYEAFHTDSVGALWVRSSAEIADDAAFTVATSRVMPVGLMADETSTDSVDEGDVGIPRMTLDRKQIVVPEAHTAGGATPAKLVSAASTNATSLKGSAGQIYSIAAFNINAAVRYLKLYNKATAPTVGTDTPVHVFAIPGATTGGGFTMSFPVGLEFTTGIAYALTTGITDADTGAVAASELLVNIGYK